MLLEVHHIGFDYAGHETDRIKPLLNNIHFTLSSGMLLHLHGKNGAGKTTLLKIIAGLLPPHTGEIRFLGVEIWQQLLFYQSHLCYVGHKTGISHALTVLENCHYDLKNDQTNDILINIEQFGLTAYKHTRCGLLSDGQRRRVGLLRLLLTHAPLWILDEPLVALDDTSLAVFMQCMTDHLEQGGMIILTSHQTLPCKTKGHQDYYLC